MTARAGGVSVHAVDVSEGRPAAGLAVRLWRLDGAARVLLAEGVCGAGGALDHPVAQGEGVVAGIYEAEFEIAAWYRANGRALPDPAFLEVAVFRFGLAAAREHFHLPLKFTPWGFSLFRGGL